MKMSQATDWLYKRYFVENKQSTWIIWGFRSFLSYNEHRENQLAREYCVLFSIRLVSKDNTRFIEWFIALNISECQKKCVLFSAGFLKTAWRKLKFGPSCSSTHRWDKGRLRSCRSSWALRSQTTWRALKIPDKEVKHNPLHAELCLSVILTVCEPMLDFFFY